MLLRILNPQKQLENHVHSSLCLYCRCYTRNFAEISACLYDLLKKNATFQRGTTAPVLRPFCPKAYTRLFAHSSTQSFEAVLEQCDATDSLKIAFSWRPVEFFVVVFQKMTEQK